MHSQQISNCWFSHKCLYFFFFIKFHFNSPSSMHSNVNFNNSLFIFNSIFFFLLTIISFAEFITIQSLCFNFTFAICWMKKRKKRGNEIKKWIWQKWEKFKKLRRAAGWKVFIFLSIIEKCKINFIFASLKLRNSSWIYLISKKRERKT